MERAPGFQGLVRRYRPLIVSSGFHELIDPILRPEGAEAAVLANHVDARPDAHCLDARSVAHQRLDDLRDGLAALEPEGGDR